MDNIVIVEFHSNCVFIKDALCKATLTKGKAKGGIYSLKGYISYSYLVCTSPSSFTVIKPHMWHHRLAHPSVEVFNRLVQTFLLQCDKISSSSVCSTCSIAKSHKSTFKCKDTFCAVPFALLYVDLWTSLVVSKVFYVDN